MLFRKFASDYAEKYRSKPVSLDETAKQELLNYRFPGNVRQLKNIADQVSLLENNGTPVTSEVIRRYLPNSSPQRFPMITQDEARHDADEREFLYKMLFDLKKEVGEMRQMLTLLLKNSAFQTFVNPDNAHHNVSVFRDENPAGFQIIDPATFSTVKNTNPQIVNAPHKSEEAIQDITPVVEDEPSLQIDKTEKELIIKALKKNRGKRKHAAADLGISERTLYRKIKQYDLENY
jgi:DNA-binding NtrC family response regulator